jgi:hypothetical protein
MNATTMTSSLRAPGADRALRFSVRFWFFVMVIGELLFTLSTVSFYGGAALKGDASALTRFMVHGYVAGDALGNLIVATHITCAVIINLGGLTQLVPKIRATVPRVHRWVGRLYLTTAAALSLAGLYITWVRAAGAPLTEHFGISLDALLILTCGFLSLHYALARQFDRHRRWALRLFLVANGSFFFRTGVFFWLLVNQGPVGFDADTFQGPFLTFLSIAESLLPLAILELYLRTQASRGQIRRYAMAAGVAVSGLVIGLGVFAVSSAVWIPLILHKPLAF